MTVLCVCFWRSTFAVSVFKLTNEKTDKRHSKLPSLQGLIVLSLMYPCLVCQALISSNAYEIVAYRPQHSFLPRMTHFPTKLPDLKQERTTTWRSLLVRVNSNIELRHSFGEAVVHLKSLTASASRWATS